MSRQVTVTYKTNPQTGQPHRPPFETTETNIEDHEKLFGHIIKDIKFSGESDTMIGGKNFSQTIKLSGTAPDQTQLLKEKDYIIQNQAEAIKAMNEEMAKLNKELSEYKRPSNHPPKK